MRHEANVISYLQHILSMKDTYPWIVIMCPTDSDAIKKLHVGLSILQPNTYTGRTSRIEGSKTKLSLIDPSDTFFIPDGQPYYITYAAWSEDLISDPKSMQTWRENATGIIQP